ncbi:MAG: TonB-dependent receptor plug domain-containing protein, partial [Cyanobacteria bacterium P01_C01_bin.70]
MKAPFKLVGQGVLASAILLSTVQPVLAEVSEALQSPERSDAETMDMTADSWPVQSSASAMPFSEGKISSSANDLEGLPRAQAEAVVITDVQISETPEGLSIILVSDQPLSASAPQVSGNALITEIPNATLELDDAATAEQFDPAEGIALVQVSNLPDGSVQVAITGSDAPPEAQVSADAGGLTFSVVPGVGIAQTDEASDAIQVVVTATRTEEEVIDLPRSVTVIEREEIEQQLELTNNLPDILGKLVPGLSPPPLQATTRGFTLRGRDALILIDGVPQGGNSSTQRALNGIAPEFIERIEVVPGASAIFGDGATGGIINIITRVPVEEGAIYDLSVGTRVGVTSIEGDSFSYNFRVGAAGADGPVDGRFSFTYDVDNARFDADGDRIPPTGAGENDEL